MLMENDKPGFNGLKKSNFRLWQYIYDMERSLEHRTEKPILLRVALLNPKLQNSSLSTCFQIVALTIVRQVFSFVNTTNWKSLNRRNRYSVSIFIQNFPHDMSEMFDFDFDILRT